MGLTYEYFALDHALESDYSRHLRHMGPDAGKKKRRLLLGVSHTFVPFGLCAYKSCISRYLLWARSNKVYGCYLQKFRLGPFAGKKDFGIAFSALAFGKIQGRCSVVPNKDIFTQELRVHHRRNELGSSSHRARRCRYPCRCGDLNWMSQFLILK